jgi:hypothetical protein
LACKPKHWRQTNQANAAINIANSVLNTFLFLFFLDDDPYLP